VVVKRVEYSEQEAKYFVYFLPLFSSDNIYIIQSDKLISLLGEFNTHIVSGGDQGSNTMMYKINRSEFNNRFIKMGGKIITYSNYNIPNRFEKQQFKENKVVYVAEDIKKYEDPV